VQYSDRVGVLKKKKKNYAILTLYALLDILVSPDDTTK